MLFVFCESKGSGKFTPLLNKGKYNAAVLIGKDVNHGSLAAVATSLIDITRRTENK